MQQQLMVRTAHIHNLTNLAPQDNNPIAQIANLMTENQKHHRIFFLISKKKIIIIEEINDKKNNYLYRVKVAYFANLLSSSGVDSEIQ